MHTDGWIKREDVPQNFREYIETVSGMKFKDIPLEEVRSFAEFINEVYDGPSRKNESTSNTK